jgi:hypothetical protein
MFNYSSWRVSGFYLRRLMVFFLLVRNSTSFTNVKLFGFLPVVNLFLMWNDNAIPCPVGSILEQKLNLNIYVTVLLFFGYLLIATLAGIHHTSSNFDLDPRQRWYSKFCNQKIITKSNKEVLIILLSLIE